MSKHLIVEKELLDKFINFLPDLVEDEVYFISLSARNKYLNEEERIKYHLGRTEMFSRQVVRSKKQFELVLNKLTGILTTRTTNSGLLFPEKALVVYANLNPSSMVRAFTAFQSKMIKEIGEALIASQRNKEGNYSGIRLADRKLMNCIQKYKSYKAIIDIDCDCADKGFLDEVEADLRAAIAAKVNRFDGEFPPEIMVVNTQGGRHILIKKENFPKKCNLNAVIERAQKELISTALEGEVVFNDNGMVPVPGTLQAGKLVTIKE